MPPEERVLMLLLGYAANQLLMLQKLLHFATCHDPEIEIEELAEVIQTHMLVRLTAGALNEAWKLVRTRFIETPVARNYLAKLDELGKNAFEGLKRQFAGSTLLSDVRNNFGFHYPDNDMVEAAFEAAIGDAEFAGLWNLYFSEHAYNSLFLLSDLIYVHGIGKLAGTVTLEEGHRKLMGEVSAAAMNFVGFAKSLFAAIWLEHIGSEMVAEEVVKIDVAPDIDSVRLPFFVEIPAPPKP